MMPVFQTFIDRLQGAEDSDALGAAMVGFAGAFGFSNFGYIGFPRPATLLPPYLTSYPLAWVHQYLERNYLEIDPVLARVMDSSAPFLWDCRDRRLQESSAQREFMSEAIDFSVQRGLAVPIRHERCGHAILTLASDRTAGPNYKRPWLGTTT